MTLTEMQMEAVWGTSRPQTQCVDCVVAIARDGSVIWHSQHNLCKKHMVLCQKFVMLTLTVTNCTGYQKLISSLKLWKWYQFVNKYL